MSYENHHISSSQGQKPAANESEIIHTWPKEQQSQKVSRLMLPGGSEAAQEGSKGREKQSTTRLMLPGTHYKSGAGVPQNNFYDTLTPQAEDKQSAWMKSHSSERQQPPVPTVSRTQLNNAPINSPQRHQGMTANMPRDIRIYAAQMAQHAQMARNAHASPQTPTLPSAAQPSPNRMPGPVPSGVPVPTDQVYRPISVSSQHPTLGYMSLSPHSSLVAAPQPGRPYYGHTAQSMHIVQQTINAPHGNVQPNTPVRHSTGVPLHRISPNLYNPHGVSRHLLSSTHQGNSYGQQLPAGLAAHDPGSFVQQGPRQALCAQPPTATQPGQPAMSQYQPSQELLRSLLKNQEAAGYMRAAPSLQQPACNPHQATSNLRQRAVYSQPAAAPTTLAPKASEKIAANAGIGAPAKEKKPRAPRKPKAAQSTVAGQNPVYFNTAQTPQLQTVTGPQPQGWPTTAPVQLRKQPTTAPMRPIPSNAMVIDLTEVDESLDAENVPEGGIPGGQYAFLMKRTPLLAGVMKKAGLVEKRSFKDWLVERNLAAKPTLRALAIAEPSILKRILSFAAKTVDVITVEPPKDPWRLKSTRSLTYFRPLGPSLSRQPSAEPIQQAHIKQYKLGSFYRSGVVATRHPPASGNAAPSLKRKAEAEGLTDSGKRQKTDNEMAVGLLNFLSPLKRKAEDEGREPFKSKRTSGIRYYATRIATTLRLVCKSWSQALSGTEINLQNIPSDKVRISGSLFKEGVISEVLASMPQRQYEIILFNDSVPKTADENADNCSMPRTILPKHCNYVDFRFPDGISRFCPGDFFGKHEFARRGRNLQFEMTVPAKMQGGFSLCRCIGKFSAPPYLVSLRLRSWMKGSERDVPVEVNKLVRHFDTLSENPRRAFPGVISIELPREDFEHKRFVDGWSLTKALKSDVPARWDIDMLVLKNFNTESWKRFQFSANIVPCLIRGVSIYVGARQTVHPGNVRTREYVDRATQDRAFDLEIFAEETWQRSANCRRIYDGRTRAVEYGRKPQPQGPDHLLEYAESNLYLGERQSWSSLENVCMLGVNSMSDLRADERKVLVELNTRRKAGAKLRAKCE